MKVIVDYKYEESLIATVYDKGQVFMKSPVNVKIPVRPYYKEAALFSCTEAKYLKWEDTVIDKITKSIKTVFKKELYGEVDIVINGLGGVVPCTV